MPATNPPTGELEYGHPLPLVMKSFQFWTILLFALSFCFHVFAAKVLHLHGHYVNPLSLNKSERFNDFTIFTEKFHYFHTADFFNVGIFINYPAAAACLLELFFKYGYPHSLAYFLCFSVLSLVTPAVLFGRALVKHGIQPVASYRFAAVLCLFSWPAILLVDRANAEVFVWLAIATGMWAYATGREWIAAVCFGVAASLKLFPFILLLLFLSAKKIWKLVAGALTFLCVSVVSLKILGPTIAIAYRGINHGIELFKQGYMAQWRTNENGIDHSIFASVKATMFVVFHHPPSDFTRSLQVYLFATAITGTLLYFLRIRKLPLLNQVLALVVISIYFTPFSGDGTLIHLYCPLAMLFILAIQAERDGVRIPGLRTVIICLLVCESFESFLVAPHLHDAVRLIGPTHCLALGVMLVTALRFPLGPPLAQTDDPKVLAAPRTNWAIG